MSFANKHVLCFLWQVENSPGEKIIFIFHRAGRERRKSRVLQTRPPDDKLNRRRKGTQKSANAGGKEAKNKRPERRQFDAWWLVVVPARPRVKYRPRMQIITSWTAGALEY